MDIVRVFVILAKIDYAARGKYGLKYPFFSKAYLCSCSVLLGVLQLYYGIFMHF